jgi:hypothetical protein
MTRERWMSATLVWWNNKKAGFEISISFTRTRARGIQKVFLISNGVTVPTEANREREIQRDSQYKNCLLFTPFIWDCSREGVQSSIWNENDDNVLLQKHSAFYSTNMYNEGYIRWNYTNTSKVLRKVRRGSRAFLALHYVYKINVKCNTSIYKIISFPPEYLPIT